MTSHLYRILTTLWVVMAAVYAVCGAVHIARDQFESAALYLLAALFHAAVAGLLYRRIKTGHGR